MTRVQGLRGHRAKPGPDEPLDRVPKCIEHPAHLSLAPFVNSDKPVGIPGVACVNQLGSAEMPV